MSLYYLVHTQSDLSFVVDYLSFFMECPTKEHMGEEKRLLRYITSTIDHADDINTRKSTSNALFFLGASLISWQSTKQRIVALSSCEVEYVAAMTTACQDIWLARLLGNLTRYKATTVKLKMDSMSALTLSKNPVFHERNKHIGVQYHFIHQCLENGSIFTEFFSTKEQLADILMKALGRVRFHELIAGIGMVKMK